MIVLRDSGGIGDVVRIGAVLDGLSTREPVTFYTDACYRALCSMIPCIASGACNARYLGGGERRSSLRPVRTWGDLAGLAYVDQSAHAPGEAVIDLFCPALRHEVAQRGAPTRSRLECWADAAGVPTPGPGSVAVRIPCEAASEAAAWRRRQKSPVVALAPASNASIRTWRNGLSAGRRTGMVGGLDRELRRRGINAVVFDTAGRGAPGESVSDDLCLQSARLALCDAVVAPDSGMLHIAAALRVPTVALFGPTDPALVLAGYTGKLVVLRGEWTPAIRREIGCARPCYGLPSGGWRPGPCGGRCAVLEGIPELAVADAVERLVRPPRRSASRRP